MKMKLDRHNETGFLIARKGKQRAAHSTAQGQARVLYFLPSRLFPCPCPYSPPTSGRAAPKVPHIFISAVDDINPLLPLLDGFAKN